MKSLISITQQSEIVEKRLLEAFPHDRGFNCFSRLWSFSMVLLVFQVAELFMLVVGSYLAFIFLLYFLIIFVIYEIAYRRENER